MNAYRLTTRQVIKALPQRFKEQYRNYPPNQQFDWGTPEQTLRALSKLNLDTATPEDIRSIMPKDWIKTYCDVCDQHVAPEGWVIGKDEEWETFICTNCLAELHKQEISLRTMV